MSEAMRRATVQEKLKKVTNCLDRLSGVIEKNKKDSQHAINELNLYKDSSEDQNIENRTQSLIQRQITCSQETAYKDYQASQTQFERIKKKVKKSKGISTFVEQQTTQKKLSQKKVQKQAHKSARKMLKTPSQIKNYQFSCLNLSPKCFSPTNFNINNEREIVSRIKKLKTKKNLCQIQSSYLQASIKVTHTQISNALLVMKSYSEESVLNTYMVKSIVKFLSQFEKEICGNGEDFLISVLSRPEKLINIINRLPDVIRAHRVLSQKRCKELFAAKKYVSEQINILNKGYIHDNILYVYLVHLHQYVQFLLNHNIIQETKRNKLFSCGECTARSKEQKTTEFRKNQKQMSHRKINQYDSQRKNDSVIKRNCKTGKLKKTKMK